MDSNSHALLDGSRPAVMPRALHAVLGLLAITLSLMTVPIDAKAGWYGGYGGSAIHRHGSLSHYGHLRRHYGIGVRRHHGAYPPVGYPYGVPYHHRNPYPHAYPYAYPPKRGGYGGRRHDGHPYAAPRHRQPGTGAVFFGYPSGGDAHAEEHHDDR